MASIVYLMCKGIKWVVGRMPESDAPVLQITPEEAPEFEWKPRYRWYTITATVLSWAAAGVLATVIPLWWLRVLLFATVVISGWKLGGGTSE